MKKIILSLLAVIFIIGISVFVFFFVGQPPRAEKIIFGVNFSQKHSTAMGLDWKENYTALLEDLGAKRLKLAVHWDLIEPEKDIYYFDDLEWQIQKAEENNAKIILLVGMKTSRWPECHIPGWAKNLSKKEQQIEILKMIENIVLKYKDNDVIWAWQPENEPFFPFGECSWSDENFLKEEILLIKSLDSLNRPVLVSDSGEGSFWIKAAKFGDIVGTTMYKEVWVSFSWIKTKMSFLPQSAKDFGFYFHYPYPPKFYWQKANIISKFFDKKVICVELQTEPWCQNLLYNCSLSEQEKTMSLENFKNNIEFAKKTGFDEFYLWGGEWMYWMKKTQNNPEIWDEAKKLF
jgi:hypothetical protein